MATVVVPWTDTFELDEPLFRDQVHALLAAGYRDLYVFGTAAEGYAVDDEQFRQIGRTFADAMRSEGAEPMIGVISLSLPTILRRLRWAYDTLGVRRFQVSLPSWGALEEAEVRAFFDAVLAPFGDAQFLHYNLLRTKRLVTASEYSTIAADHPNLAATKNSTDSIVRMRALLDQAPMLQHFLNEHGFLYGSLVGECGLLISMAATNLEMGKRYFEAGRARDLATLAQLEGELTRIGEAFARCAAPDGVPRIDGAYDKVLWKLHDPRFPLRLLPPYAGASPDAAETFGDFLRQNYPHWAPE
jgi:dihydrodipicolinate synthase/N-acetylneuraminate lyase